MVFDLSSAACQAPTGPKHHPMVFDAIGVIDVVVFNDLVFKAVGWISSKSKITATAALSCSPQSAKWSSMSKPEPPKGAASFFAWPPKGAAPSKIAALFFFVFYRFHRNSKWGA